jgi:two-component SAPR family response regulator
MPGARNGLALAEHARRALPDVKVVLMSGSARFADYEHTHPWLDESMILHKPFGRDELARALAKKAQS